MAIFSYQANDLFDWLTAREDIVVLDVRNDKDFGRFQVESPYPFEMINVSYYDFMEVEDESVAKVPAGRKIRIVCMPPVPERIRPRPGSWKNMVTRMWVI